ncbi:type III-B CRISPR module RAMP protein Cmr4 [Polyangium mundeleinium]|uniref:Type III-B CRISPR module RAMP protein Cmr4 n=1 Tax=Polyangium mundeleinium TaxID=2995306 RepID=A0ABT5EI38_9BACT|nr:type III-B CRISPR module RAMP protein Cmr4 [Polyangium mundeleinium]MDC0741484.1 type III-B CRISPR module RAMP protein Cmr4 [Polyangium mundeleinium]
MKTRPYLLHALSPLHVGTGQAVDVIDLPIARMRSTGVPLVPGSAIKGVLREEQRRRRGEADATFLALFGPLRKIKGPEGDTDFDHAGAVVASDARLLALPVRSFRGTFALVTSPLLLQWARRDLEGVAGLPGPIAPFDGPRALVSREPKNQHTDGKVYLEDLDLEAKKDERVASWSKFLLERFPEAERGVFEGRLVVVDDETMTFLWETATQVDTRIRIDPERGTVAEGALWTEESLPAETLLVGVLAADRSYKKGVEMRAEAVLDAALDKLEYVQFGGKATIGRGQCRILPFPAQGDR